MFICTIYIFVYFHSWCAKLLSGYSLAMWTMFKENTPGANLYPWANLLEVWRWCTYFGHMNATFFKWTDFEIILLSFFKHLLNKNWVRQWKWFWTPWQTCKKCQMFVFLLLEVLRPSQQYCNYVELPPKLMGKKKGNVGYTGERMERRESVKDTTRVLAQGC